jgi:uncharacterized protein YecE (DUF72 family)
VTARAWIGCSGWNYQSWREPVYDRRPASRWLAHYATLFDTVEVNASFYRLPTRAAVARWVEQTPDGFVFAVKVSRYLTHIRRLRGVAEGWKTLCERIEPLMEAGRLGPLLWQLPGNFARDDARLAEALAELPPGRHAFEFRHPSWFCRPVEAMLREHGVALVIGDHPQRPFQTHALTADWTFVRLHYGHRGRRGNYSPRELDEWSDRIRRWRRRGDCFVYLNNDWEAFAVKNALTLRRELGE